MYIVYKGGLIHWVAVAAIGVFAILNSFLVGYVYNVYKALIYWAEAAAISVFAILNRFLVG